MTSKSWVMSDPTFECDIDCPQHRSWPWNGHRKFGYDLVRNLKPGLIVELGTYWGTSFFTFCQAIKDFELTTRCVAVDTWRGDDHTGGYEDEVYTTVKSISGKYYESVNTELKRMLFQEALNDFPDNSIDLLHIDGFHSYEAAQEDFTTWLPKLATNGVILFHDIADSCDYGSVRFWKELTELYPSYTFQHSWGLGVLFPKGDAGFHYLENSNFADKRKIYQYQSELLLTQLQVSDLTEFNAQQDHYIKDLENKIAERDGEFVALSARMKKIESSPVYKRLRLLKQLFKSS